MGKKQNSQRSYTSLVWGMLAILWGFTILFDFVPFGAGLIGTGLVLLGVNVVRALKGIPIENDNAIFGTLVLVWGGLELARPILRQLSGSIDWDWGIFAILLIVLGGIVLAHEVQRIRKNIEQPH